MGHHHLRQQLERCSAHIIACNMGTSCLPFSCDGPTGGPVCASYRWDWYIFIISQVWITTTPTTASALSSHPKFWEPRNLFRTLSSQILRCRDYAVGSITFSTRQLYCLNTNIDLSQSSGEPTFTLLSVWLAYFALIAHTSLLSHPLISQPRPPYVACQAGANGFMFLSTLCTEGWQLYEIKAQFSAL